jgi:predicted acylesterase/phospholipase RssA
MTIKHLVFAGGGPSLIHTLGAYQHMISSNFVEFKNIETIYGTSAGAIVGTVVCLNFDNETVNDYIIKRPWQEVFTLNVQTILDAYTKRGMYDTKVIEKCFKPLFDAKDISLNVSLQEFFDITKIELHFCAFEINNFVLEDISYVTHPTLPLMTAIHMSCSLPLLITPVCIDDKCYMDGGIVSNYPLKQCLESGKVETEVLGFKNQYDIHASRVHSESNLLDYLFCLLYKIVHNMNTANIQPKIKYEIVCPTETMNIENCKNTVRSAEVRSKLLQNGIEYGKTFLASLQDGI